jgi:hypothetical protein
MTKRAIKEIQVIFELKVVLIYLACLEASLFVFVFIFFDFQIEIEIINRAPRKCVE